jgi:LmbE family N-acetylglucosaminyl deacetylase
MFKKLFNFILFFLLFCALSCKNREDVRPFAPVETFPEDTILQSIKVQRAMIVIAHDDDMCAMAGTVSLLNENGWEIVVISLSKSPARNNAQKEACKNILDTVMFIDLRPDQIRNDYSDEEKGYLAFPKDSFEYVFNKQLISEEYVRHISEFNPTIIFTLDNEMGGYGHPEHVLISQMVLDLAMEKRINPKFIYQSVFTKHMEKSIMNRHERRMKSWGLSGEEWKNAKKIYNVEGMPEPTFQINILPVAQMKMAYLKSYNKRERQIMGFFIPEFEKYKAEEYFAIFDREFFRVIVL